MWMAELSERSDVPVPTIKYYLREGLLPSGQSVGATRATYDDSHVRRLHLIRALVTVGGMGLDRVRDVLTALEDTSADLHQVLAVAHEQLSPVPQAEPSDVAQAQVAALMRDRGWRVQPEGRHARAVAAALDTLTDAGLPLDEDILNTCAEAAGLLAASEVSGVPSEDREGAATWVITGTVLVEPVLLSLRRLAHEHHSSRRFT